MSLGAFRLGPVPTLFDAHPNPARRPDRVVREGIVHLPAFLTMEQQDQVVSTAREYARRTASLPWGMRQRRVKSGTMSAHLMSLGEHWDYERHRYIRGEGSQAVPAIPETFVGIAHAVLRMAGELDESLAPWVAGFRVEAALVNYYPPGSGMGLHQDGYEDSGAPVVSLSIGDSAVFRAGGTIDRNKPWDGIYLESGDALVFGGPARDIFHGIVRLDDNTAPMGCGLRQGRINVTFRQVR